MKPSKKSTYKIYLDSRVVKQINSLHPKDRAKVTQAIDKLEVNFSSMSKITNLKKLSAQDHSWRLRVGGVRILFYQNKAKKQLEIYKIGYRGGVYKK